MKRIFFLLVIVIQQFVAGQATAQESTSKNVVLITLDGVRWQELFSGADSLLVTNHKYVEDTTDLKNHFWNESPLKRRELLFPFLWKEVSKTGQIHGNRNLGSQVDLTNESGLATPDTMKFYQEKLMILE